jgi:hypothetical protein
MISLIKDITKIRVETLKSSLVEVIMIALSATLPLWFFYPLIALVADRIGDTLGLWTTSISGGEFYLYSTATAGPLIYIILKDYAEIIVSPVGSGPAPRNGSYGFSLTFPHGFTFVMGLMLICAASSLGFGIVKIINPKNYATQIWLSGTMYILTVIINFAVIAFKKDMSSFSKTIMSEEHAFVTEWKDMK